MKYPYYLMGLEVWSDVEFNVEQGQVEAPIASVHLRHAACDGLPPVPTAARRLTESPYVVDGAPLFVICEWGGVWIVHVSPWPSTCSKATGSRAHTATRRCTTSSRGT